MSRTDKCQLLRRYDPSLPPAWRWELAGKIVQGEHFDRRMVDAKVRAAAKLRAELEGAMPLAQLAVWGGPPSLVQAYELYKEGGLRRAEVEARLVAGQSDEEIAEKCGLAPKIVAAFAEMFCDIRCCLGARDYLVNHLIGFGVQIGFQDREVGPFWAWIAMGGGPLILDTFIEAFHTAHRPGQPARLGVYLEPKVGLRQDLQAVVAQAVLPRTERADEAFQESHLLVMEAEAASDPDRAAFLREKARGLIIRSAWAYLAGKPIPRPRRRRTTLTAKDGSARSPSPRLNPLPLAEWDNMVVAEFSSSRVKKRRSRLANRGSRIGLSQGPGLPIPWNTEREIVDS